MHHERGTCCELFMKCINIINIGISVHQKVKSPRYVSFVTTVTPFRPNFRPKCFEKCSSFLMDIHVLITFYYS